MFFLKKQVSTNVGAMGEGVGEGWRGHVGLTDAKYYL